MTRFRCLLASLVLAILLVGCTQAPPPLSDPNELRLAAVAVIEDVLEHQPKPVVDSTVPANVARDALLVQYQLQSQALEILGEFPAVIQSQWISQALSSPSDGVKYGALLTVGRVADYQGGRLGRSFLGQVRVLSAYPNDFIKAAAAYALYRTTGDAAAVGLLPGLLDVRGLTPQQSRDLASLRAETLYILSLMPQLNPEPLLRDALTDPSPAVQQMAQNRLAVLGDRQMIDRVINAAQSPHADDQLDALEALGQAPLKELTPLVQMLKTARLAEARVAAARALALHGDRSGLDLAICSLDYVGEKLRPEDAARDPLHDYRPRFLAALTVGACGDYDRGAAPLLNIIRTSSSKRYRLTAARAALLLLSKSGKWDPGVSVSPMAAPSAQPGKIRSDAMVPDMP